MITSMNNIYAGENLLIEVDVKKTCVQFVRNTISSFALDRSGSDREYHPSRELPHPGSLGYNEHKRSLKSVCVFHEVTVGYIMVLDCLYLNPTKQV